jgi:hypothetical protein
MNIHGWGLVSESLSVLATNKPDQPDAVTTAIENQNVRITWLAPSDNFAEITSYKIYIAAHYSETYIQESLYCEPENPEVTQ